MSIRTYPAISYLELMIRDQLLNCSANNETWISQDDLAARMDRKVTQAFRNHMSSLQAQGWVTRFTYQTPRGGYKVAYSIKIGAE